MGCSKCGDTRHGDGEGRTSKPDKRPMLGPGTDNTLSLVLGATLTEIRRKEGNLNNDPTGRTTEQGSYRVREQNVIPTLGARCSVLMLNDEQETLGGPHA